MECIKVTPKYLPPPVDRKPRRLRETPCQSQKPLQRFPIHKGVSIFAVCQMTGPKEAMALWAGSRLAALEITYCAVIANALRAGIRAPFLPRSTWRWAASTGCPWGASGENLGQRCVLLPYVSHSYPFPWCPKGDQHGTETESKVGQTSIKQRRSF